MSVKKLDFRRFGMFLALLLCCSGCCVGIVTKVRNKTGKEISLTVIHPQQNPSAPVTIPAGTSRICDGVIVGDTSVYLKPDTSWIISDDKSQFIFDNVSPIGTMRGKSRTESRFTSMFPCNRVTQHVKLETNMVIYAVGGVGQEISQPPGFPIHCTSTNANDYRPAVQQQGTAFAWSRQTNDLALLKRKLQAEQIHCLKGDNDGYVDSFRMSQSDFTRARTAAVRIIREFSLTVNVESDTNASGYEVWENGKKTARIDF